VGVEAVKENTGRIIALHECDKRLIPGDWILYRYGFEPSRFYVKYASKNTVLLGKTSWLADSYVAVPIRQFELEEAQYLGRGAERRWRRYLPRFIRVLVCPFTLPDSARLGE